MDTNIWIFSRPIRSGKTTALMQWIENRNDVGGFLVPDVGQLRKLHTLQDRKWYDFEVPAKKVDQLTTEDLVRISKFNFYKSSFELARTTLLQDMENQVDWIIVDEVGKLEMNGLGLEPAVGRVLEHYKQKNTAGNLLLVVRRELLNMFIERYGLKHFQVIENLNSIG
jgi:nucleoside-triphosphatase